MIAYTVLCLARKDTLILKPILELDWNRLLNSHTKKPSELTQSGRLRQWAGSSPWTQRRLVFTDAGNTCPTVRLPTRIARRFRPAVVVTIFELTPGLAYLQLDRDDVN